MPADFVERKAACHYLRGASRKEDSPPTEWRKALDAGRLLILSPFEKRPQRPDIESARRRNELVAALSDEVLIIHAEPGGQIDQLVAVAGFSLLSRKNACGFC